MLEQLHHTTRLNSERQIHTSDMPNDFVNLLWLLLFGNTNDDDVDDDDDDDECVQERKMSILYATKTRKES
jgi:hypothetical protein